MSILAVILLQIISVALIYADVPVPIGTTVQTNPFESNPTTGTVTGTATPSADLINNGKDGSLDTSGSFGYGAPGNVQYGTFTQAPSAFTISWVDFKISYKASGLDTSDDRYRILYYVSTGNTPTQNNAIILQDWTNYGEYIYNDADDSGTVTAGDKRLTIVGMYPAGSNVVTGNRDIGMALVGFNSDEKHREVTANGIYDITENVYRDRDGSGDVTAGDTRLLIQQAIGTGFATGSSVGGGDPDLGIALIGFTATEKHAENIDANLLGSKYDFSVAKFDTTLGGEQAQRAWSLQSEPNDAAWNWTDVNNIKVRFEAQRIGTDSGMRVTVYEVWLSIYSGALPPQGVSIQPSSIVGLHANDKFFVDIYAVNVVRMWGYQFTLYFDTSVLNALQVIMGHEYFSYDPLNDKFARVIDNTEGFVAATYKSFFGDSRGFTGNTPLARVYFNVTADGYSLLHFGGQTPAKLVDVKGLEINVKIYDGVFSTSEWHDVAVTDVTTNSTWAMPGGVVQVNVTVVNVGAPWPENFTVSAYYESNLIGTLSVTLLLPATQSILTFNWTTTGVLLGLYRINGTASVVAGDSNTANNWKLWTGGLDNKVLIGRHDVKVLNVTRCYPTVDVAVPYNQMLKVLKGTTVYINVTVMNNGTFVESNFNVTVFWDAGVVGSKSIANGTVTSLNTDANTTLTLAWNTGTKWEFGTDKYGNPINVVLGNVTAVVAPEFPPGLFPRPKGVPYEKGVDYDFTGDNIFTDGRMNVSRDIRMPFAKLSYSLVSAYSGQPANKPFINQPVTFSTLGSLTPNGTRITSYRWDFGDDSAPVNVTEQSVQHSYSSVGTYVVNLTIANNVSLTHSVESSGGTNIMVLKRNIAIVSANMSAAQVVAGANVTINVKIKNDGDNYEYFNVTTYYGNHVIQVLNITENLAGLINGAETTLSFVWNTSSVASGTYSIRAVAQLLQFETNSSDNNATVGSLSVLWHNLAVIDVTVSATEAVVGESVTISVTVQNKGNFTETFTVSVKANDTDVESAKTVTDLASGESETLEFTWSTSGLQLGVYTIKAEASTVNGETLVSDNTMLGDDVTLVAQPTNLLLYAIVGIVIIAVVGAVLVYFFRVRKPKTTPT